MAMVKTNNYSCEHLARTNEPEAKRKISNIFGYLLISHISKFYADYNTGDFGY
jgi:hypothetical protein